MAEYHLQITLPQGVVEAPDTGHGFTNSVGEWGRRISIHLDGFSSDGQHVFGVVSEGGRDSILQVFDFKRGGPHAVFDVREGSSKLRAAGCGSAFAVAGTTGTGEIVLEPDTTRRCRSDHRWILVGKGQLRDATKEDSIVPLYAAPKVP